MYKKFIYENCWTRFGSLKESSAISKGKFITATQTAELLGVSKKTIYEIVRRSGASTFRGLKNSLHFYLPEFTEWLSIQNITPVSPIKEETYSLQGAIEVSGFRCSCVYKMAERHNVTRIRIGGRTHFCKREMDEMLNKTRPLYSDWIAEKEAAAMLCVPQVEMLALALMENVAVKPGQYTPMYLKRDIKRLITTYQRRACHA